PVSKTFHHHRIIQRGEKNQQSAPAHSQAKKRVQFIKVRRDEAGLQRVDRIAAKAVMLLSTSGADKPVHLVTERHQTEKIALLLGSQAKRQRRSNESLKRCRRSSLVTRQRCFHHH